jgi:multiple sugar transport system ATP-binding protein
MNFVTGRLVRDGGAAVVFADGPVAGAEDLSGSRPGLDSYFGREVILGVRPSDFEDAELADPAWPRLSARVDVTEALGTEMHVLFRIDAPPVRRFALRHAASAANTDADEAALQLEGGKSL